MTTTFTRVVNAAEARAQYGPLLDRITPWLAVRDPLGDAAVAALMRDGWPQLERAFAGARDVSEPVRALVDAVSPTPDWVDHARVAQGGRLLYRTAVLGGIALGASSLIHGYCSPAGNKPLAITGTLERDVERRLADTGRFVVAVHSDRGLLAGGAGWRALLRVRLMHSHVRATIDRDGGWDYPAWGAPINQHDLVATSLLFSSVWVDGVRRLGVSVRDDEAEDHLHLWRWASQILGVEPTLLPKNNAEARDLWGCIQLTQGPPDDDARRLVHALLDQTKLLGAPGLGLGLCRALLGDELADALQLRRTRWRHAPRLAQVVVRPVELVRRVSPRAEARLFELGRQYWAIVAPEPAGNAVGRG